MTETLINSWKIRPAKPTLTNAHIAGSTLSGARAKADSAHKLISAVSSLYSITRVTNYLRSIGIKVGNNFVSLCVDWFQDAYFLFSVPIFSPSVSKQNANPKKIYCIDHGLVKSVVPPVLKDDGHLLENIIFIHLRRQSENIWYYRTKKRNEVDFVWIDDDHTKNLVQISLTLQEENTKKREVTSLFDAMAELSINKGIIVTLNEEETIKKDDTIIEIIPAWKYLLLPGNIYCG